VNIEVENYKMPCTVVANNLIPAIFPKIRPLLEKGREYWEDYYTLKDIKLALIKGDFQLWVGVEGPDVKLMAISTIVIYPRSVWLRIPFISGERVRDAVYFLPTIESWAKTRGAVGIEGYSTSRLGWERIMKHSRFSRIKTGLAFKMKFEE
jgi:hypothetical protein